MNKLKTYKFQTKKIRNKKTHIQGDAGERVLPTSLSTEKGEQKRKRKERFPAQPEENILYFIEKNSPKLKAWQREIVRIVRKVSQYFYPQGQTKVINEGCATFCHYEIVNKMFEEGYLDDGFMLEFMHHHSNVIFQPGFDSKFYSGLNPYTLGFLNLLISQLGVGI